MEVQKIRMQSKIATRYISVHVETDMTIISFEIGSRDVIRELIEILTHHYQRVWPGAESSISSSEEEVPLQATGEIAGARTMKKGDIVLVKARVDTRYHTLTGEVIHIPGNISCPDVQRKLLVRYEEKQPWPGMIIGFSFLQTGWRHIGDYDDSPHLRPDKYHRVWLVEPVISDRWFKPVPCLENDLTPVEIRGELAEDPELIDEIDESSGDEPPSSLSPPPEPVPFPDPGGDA